MKRQPAPAYVSPFWFFTKIGIICVLGVVAWVQVHAMLRKASPVPTVAPIAVKSVAKQPKQVQAPKADAQAKSSKQPAKPTLTETLQNPETYAMIKGEFTRRLDAPYGKLYRELGLDAATLQKLRGLLAEKELSLAEGFRLAEESQTPLSADSLAALRADSDTSIKELLGETAYENYKFYERTLPARNHVNELEERLSYKSEPLTSDQYYALVSALSALPDPNIKPDRGAWLGNYNPEITKESLKVAKNILTPLQFAVYEKEYESMLHAQRVEKKYSQYYSPPKRNAKNNKKNK